MALPLTANRITGSLLATFENVLIPQRLVMYGLTRTEAISVFGQITGMVLPLILFPSALLNALSISLVPAISEALAVNNKERIAATAAKAFLFTNIVGIGAGALFLTVPSELGQVIYNQNIGRLLFLFGLMCPFMYINITLSGILNGLGRQVFIFINSLISSIINLAFIYFLVPRFGAEAFVAGWFISLLFVVSSSLLRINKDVGIKVQVGCWFLKPLVAATAAGLLVRVIANKFFFTYLSGPVGLVLCLCSILGFYALFIILTKCITLDEIKSVYKRTNPKQA